jgi:hypothetical protein
MVSAEYIVSTNPLTLRRLVKFGEQTAACAERQS